MFAGMAVGLVWLATFPLIVRSFGGTVGPGGSAIVKLSWIAGFFVFMMIGPLLVERRAVAAGLSCPACKKKFQATSGMMVVASGRCGYCGADVCV
jgi:hypothetical protein